MAAAATRGAPKAPGQLGRQAGSCRTEPWKARSPSLREGRHARTYAQCLSSTRTCVLTLTRASAKYLVGFAEVLLRYLRASQTGTTGSKVQVQSWLSPRSRYPVGPQGCLGRHGGVHSVQHYQVVTLLIYQRKKRRQEGTRNRWLRTCQGAVVLEAGYHRIAPA